eukprot:3760735-Pleurochrysis_carterae.AAC.1
MIVLAFVARPLPSSWVAKEAMREVRPKEGGRVEKRFNQDSRRAGRGAVSLGGRSRSTGPAMDHLQGRLHSRGN